MYMPCVFPLCQTCDMERVITENCQDSFHRLILSNTQTATPNVITHQPLYLQILWHYTNAVIIISNKVPTVSCFTLPYKCIYLLTNSTSLPTNTAALICGDASNLLWFSAVTIAIVYCDVLIKCQGVITYFVSLRLVCRIL